MSGFWITLAVLALVILFFISLYNRLVALKNKVVNAFGQIDVQLKRRHDLIPNLVETARAYMTHERSTLEAVVNARNTAQAAGQLAAQQPGDAQALAAMAQAEGALSSTLGRFFALAEAYPDLKANQTMMQLSEELTTTENKVAFARQAFNDAVMELNTAIQSFPAVVFAGALGFSNAALLQPLESEAERKAPVVRF
ncbi:MAG: LemA family protein [Candidatus Thiothrix putei]|uniref:LemA family protein n=1 Tax=Candidatus Thiothrix putei TaxID=3080811 RepID=A0AA95KQB9_9GAMM|nr:MAG: LemA family protein [Candidatus Thiothrix putei]